MRIYCEDCRHWNEADEECHRREPQVIFCGPESGPLTLWPETKPDGWCSEAELLEDEE